MDMNVSEVVAGALLQKPHYVCITGGEPFLQKDEVAELARHDITAGTTGEQRYDQGSHLHPVIQENEVLLDSRA